MSGQPERTGLKQPDGSINGGELLREVSRLREWLQTLEEAIQTAKWITPPIGRPRLLSKVQEPPTQPWPALDRPIYRLDKGDPRFPELSDEQILAMAERLNLEAETFHSVRWEGGVETIYKIRARTPQNRIALFPFHTSNPHLIRATSTEVVGSNPASALREYLFRVRVGIDEESVELNPDSVAYNEPDLYLPTTAVLLLTKTPIPWYVTLLEKRTVTLPAHKKFCEEIAPEIPGLLAERSAHAQAQDEQFRAAYDSVKAK